MPLTGQSMWSLSSSLWSKGGGMERVIEWPLAWERTTWTGRPWECNPGLGRRVTLTRPGQSPIHVSTDRKSLQISNSFSDVSASKRTTLESVIRSEADSKGSKGAVTRPSRTTDKSQEGTAVGRTGLRRLAPRMKAETTDASPRGSHPALSGCNGRYINPKGGSSRPRCQPFLQKTPALDQQGS